MSYLRNLGRSFGAAAPVIVKNELKSIFHSIDNISSSQGDISSAIAASKNILKNEIGGSFGDILSTVKKGITTGKFYDGEEAENKKSMSSLGFDESDFFDEDDDYDSSANLTSDGDTSGDDPLPTKKITNVSLNGGDSSGTGFISDTIAKSAMSSASVISSTNIAGSNLISKTNQAIAKINVKLMSDHISATREASWKQQEFNERQFIIFSDISDALADIRSAIDDQRKLYDGAASSILGLGSGDKDQMYVNGQLNLGAYTKSIITKMMEPFEDGGVFKIVMSSITNPIMSGLELGFNKILNHPKLKLFAESLDIIGHLPTAFANKLHELSKSDNGFVAGIASFLKPERETAELNNGNYKKDAVRFDGITKRAITHVIPSLLSQILVAVSKGKQQQQFYNYDSGKFVNAGSVAESLSNNIQGAMIDMTPFQNMIERESGKMGKDLDMFSKQLKTVMFNAAKTGKFFHDVADEEVGPLANTEAWQASKKMYGKMTVKQRANFNKDLLNSYSSIKDVVNNEDPSSTISQLLSQGNTGNISDIVAKGGNLSPEELKKLTGAKGGKLDPKVMKKLEGWFKQQAFNDGGVGRSILETRELEKSGSINKYSQKFNNFIGKHFYGGEEDKLGNSDSVKKRGFVDRLLESVSEVFKVTNADGSKSNPRNMGDVLANLNVKINETFESIKSYIGDKVIDPAKKLFTDKVVNSKFINGAKDKLASGLKMVGGTLSKKLFEQTGDASFLSMNGLQEIVSSGLAEKYGIKLTKTGEIDKRSSLYKQASDNTANGTTKGVGAFVGQKLSQGKDWAINQFDDIKKKILDVTWGSQENPGFLRTFGTTLNEGVLQPIVGGLKEFLGMDKNSDTSMADGIKAKLGSIVSIVSDKVTQGVAKFFGNDKIKKFSDFTGVLRDKAQYFFDKYAIQLEEKILTPMSVMMDKWRESFKVWGAEAAEKSKDFFNTYVFGDGANSIKTKLIKPVLEWTTTKIIKPFKDEVVDIFNKGKEFVKNDIIKPLAGTLSPYIQELKIQFTMMKDWSIDHAKRLGVAVVKSFSSAGNGAAKMFGLDLGELLEEKVLNPIKEMWSNIKGVVGSTVRKGTSAATGWIRNTADKLRVKHLTSGSGDYIGMEEIDRLRTEGKLTMTDAEYDQHKLNNGMYTDAKNKKKAILDAKIAAKQAERNKEKAKQEAWKAERARNGKLNTDERLKRSMENNSQDTKLDAENADIFDVKDVSRAKSASEKASLIVANESKKHTAFFKKSATIGEKTNSLLTRLVELVGGNKSNKKNDKNNGISGSSKFGLTTPDGEIGTRDENGQLITEASSLNGINSRTGRTGSRKNKRDDVYNELYNIEDKNKSTKLNGLQDDATLAQLKIQTAVQEKQLSESESIRKFIKSNLSNLSTLVGSIATVIVGQNNIAAAKSMADIAGGVGAGANGDDANPGKKKGFFGKLFSIIKDGGKSTILSIAKAPFAIITGITDAISNSIGTLTSTIVKIGSGLLNAVTTVGKTIVNFGATLIDGAGKLITGIANSAETIFKGATNILTSLITSTAKVVEVGISSIIKVGESLVKSIVPLAKGLMSVASGVLKIMAPLLGGAVKVAGYIAGKTIDAGSSIVGGIWNKVTGKSLGGRKEIYITGGYLDGIREVVITKAAVKDDTGGVLHGPSLNAANDDTGAVVNPELAGAAGEKKNIGQTFGEMKAKAAEKVKQLMDFKFKENLLENTSGTNERIDGMHKSFKTWVPMLMMGLASIGKAIVASNVVKAGASVLGGILSGAGALLGRGTGGLMGKLGDLILGKKDRENMGPNRPGRQSKGLITKVKDIGTSAIEKVKKSGFGNSIKNVYNSMAKGVGKTSFGEKALSALKGAGKSLKGGKFAPTALLAGMALSVAEDSVEDEETKKVIGVASDITSFAGTGAMIGSFILPGAGTAIGGAIGAITGLVVNQWGNIKTGLSRFFFGDDAQYDEDGNIIAYGTEQLTFWEIVKYGTTQLWDKTMLWVDDKIDATNEWFNDKISSMGNWFVTKINSLTDSVKTIFTKDFWVDQVGKAFKFFSDAGAKLYELISNPKELLRMVKDTAVDAVTSTYTGAKDTVTGAANKVGGWFSGAKDWMFGSDEENANKANRVSKIEQFHYENIKKEYEAKNGAVKTGSNVEERLRKMAKMQAEKQAANEWNSSQQGKDITKNTSGVKPLPASITAELRQLNNSPMQGDPGIFTRAQVDEAINIAAKANGIPADLMHGMAEIESSKRYWIVNKQGYAGLYQFGEAAWKDFSPDPSGDRLNPYLNAMAAANFIKSSAARFKKEGIPINASTLYLAHQQGQGGFSSIFRAARDGTPISSTIAGNMANNPAPGVGKTTDPQRFIMGWANHVEKKTGLNGTIPGMSDRPEYVRVEDDNASGFSYPQVSLPGATSAVSGASQAAYEASDKLAKQFGAAMGANDQSYRRNEKQIGQLGEVPTPVAKFEHNNQYGNNNVSQGKESIELMTELKSQTTKLSEAVEILRNINTGIDKVGEKLTLKPGEQLSPGGVILTATDTRGKVSGVMQISSTAKSIAAS